MKKLVKLNGVKALNKKEQKSINGGLSSNRRCYNESDCSTHHACCSGVCIDLLLVFEMPEGCI